MSYERLDEMEFGFLNGDYDEQEFQVLHKKEYEPQYNSEQDISVWVKDLEDDVIYEVTYILNVNGSTRDIVNCIEEQYPPFDWE